MAHFNYIFVSWDPGTFLTQFWDEILQRFDPIDNPISSVTRGAYGGYRAIIVDRTLVSGDTATQTFQCLGCAAAAKQSAKQVANSPGFGSVRMFHDQRGVPPGLGIPGLKTMFTDYHLANVEWILEDWCDAVVTLGTPVGFMITDIYAGTVAASVQVETDGEVFFLNQSVVYCYPLVAANDGTVVTHVGPVQPAPGAATQGGASAADLAKVVQALQDIAHQDVAVSINDSTAIAMMGGGEIIIP